MAELDDFLQLQEHTVTATRANREDKYRILLMLKGKYIAIQATKNIYNIFLTSFF